MRGQGKKRNKPIRGRLGEWILIAILVVFVARQPELLTPSVTAQSYRPEFVAASVYQKLPDIPKANQYRPRDKKEVDLNNTLLSRVIRYHQDVKKRPTPYRLDWQLTMGDYLGVNEEMIPERYPGAGFLTSNPMEADIQLIRQLSRAQRSQLIDAIVSIYTPIPTPQVNPTPTPIPTPGVSPVPTPSQIRPSQPGDADLLKF